MSEEEKNEDKDINDVFNDLLLNEERVIEEGYKEGFVKGAAEENPEGYHLGYHRGAELGAELGYYLGVAESYLTVQDLSPKVRNNLVTLVKLIKDFPQANDKEVDIITLADNIRTLYKKVCARLKVDTRYPETDNLSF